jgi:hypothetical protein
MLVESYMDERSDHSDWLQIAMSISEGVEDLEWTMWNITHEKIATIYVLQQIKEAKAAPNIDE